MRAVARAVLWHRSAVTTVTPAPRSRLRSTRRHRTAGLALALALGACNVGNLDPAPDGGTDHPPPASDGGITLPPDFGVLTSPRLGDTGDPTAPVAVAGLHTRPGQVIAIEVLSGGVWTAIGQATTDTTPAVGLLPDGGDGDARYAFHATVDLSAAWPRGGLVQLRARDADSVLVDFFHDSDACLGASSTWRERARACGEYLDRGVVLASVDGEPDLGPTKQLFLDDKGAVGAAETDAYYAAIGAPPTEAEFEARFLQRDIQTMTYYNVGDLGVGRGMKCGHFTAASGQQGTACASSNFGKFGGTVAEGLDAAVQGAIKGNHAGAFASVCMTFTPPLDQPNAVQFFVYGADDKLVNRALLDTHGDNQAIPNNCLSCHGSNASYDPVTHAVTGARFLPFDPQAFEWANLTGFRRQDQEANLRALNAIVYDGSASPAVQELLRGFYGGAPATSTAPANGGYVPPGWRGQLQEHVYREVVAPYCRACHVSRGNGDERESLDFAIADQLTSRATIVAQVVCGNGNARVHRMPDAQVSQHRFWSGPARAYLAALVDLPACTPF